MTRRIKRTTDYELVLDIKNDNFIRSPRELQRNWVINRLMKESAEELDHLNNIASRFVRGGDTPLELERAQALLDDNDIMEDWQIPIMRAMAACVASSAGDVLEIGMGRCVASDFVQSYKPRSHTLVECNDSIVETFPQWRQQYSSQDITLLHGMWQDRVADMSTYDGILFHTYPLSEAEFVEQVVNSVTFAEHFFATAQKLLRPGGVLTYLTNEIDSLSRAHQRALFEHFSEFSLSLIDNLPLPENTRDALWIPQMVIIKAVR